MRTRNSTGNLYSYKRHDNAVINRLIKIRFYRILRPILKLNLQWRSVNCEKGKEIQIHVYSKYFIYVREIFIHVTARDNAYVENNRKKRKMPRSYYNCLSLFSYDM